MILTRVGFTLIGGAQWTGGYNYLVNLLSALDHYEAHRIRSVLFTGNDAGEDVLRPFLQMQNVEVVRTSAFDASHLRTRLAQAILLGRDGPAVRAFREHAVDVVFESATFYGWRSPIPAIAWLPDFQHRRLPGQFGLMGYWRREVGFMAQVASKRHVMLSSEDARRDAERYYPGSRGRTSVVRFASRFDERLLEERPEHVLALYGLPPAFFFLPNQFWKHKNHAVVIEALRLIRQRGEDVVVVATGSAVDHRNPQHFEMLKQSVEDGGLQASFRMLGLVPRSHVVSLMRTCMTLINPSLFEGWSSTVEEARALGVPMLLSAIDVHREQLGDKATYFAPSDPADLAGKMLSIAATVPAPAHPRGIDPSSDDSVRHFAANFANVVMRAKGQAA